MGPKRRTTYRPASGLESPRSISQVLWIAIMTVPFVIARAQAGAEAEAEITATPTVVDVWGPGLSSAYWTQMVATVVTSNDDWTSYCAFCRTDIEIPCTLAEGSFTFGLGPSTYFLSTPLPSSRQTRTLECEIDGTTAATCVVSDLPDDEPNTSTYSGSGLEWGLLTIGDRPNSLPTLEITTDAITDASGNTIDLTDTRVTSTPTASDNIAPTSASAMILGLGGGFHATLVAAFVVAFIAV